MVADLAAAMPAPTDGGKTYTFTLRRDGIRYSTGALVEPTDIRSALERDFELGSPGAAYYSKIPALPCAGRGGIATSRTESSPMPI